MSADGVRWVGERPAEVTEEAERLISYWTIHKNSAETVRRWAVSDLLKFARLVLGEEPE